MFACTHGDNGRVQQITSHTRRAQQQRNTLPKTRLTMCAYHEQEQRRTPERSVLHAADTELWRVVLQHHAAPAPGISCLPGPRVKQHHTCSSIPLPADQLFRCKERSKKDPSPQPGHPGAIARTNEWVEGRKQKKKIYREKELTRGT